MGRSPEPLLLMLGRIVDSTVAARLVKQLPAATVLALLRLVAGSGADRVERALDDWVDILLNLRTDAGPSAASFEREESAREFLHRIAIPLLLEAHARRTPLPSLSDRLVAALAVETVGDPDVIRDLLRGSAPTRPRPGLDVREWLEGPERGRTGPPASATRRPGDPHPAPPGDRVAVRPGEPARTDGTVPGYPLRSPADPRPRRPAAIVRGHEGPPTSGDAGDRPPRFGAEERPSNEGQPPADSPWEGRSEPDPLFSPESGHYIENAGLVLLWPFLTAFFRKLSLVEDGGFVTPEANERAVLLTQYVATGEAECSEHRLLINKILAGWPPRRTVHRELQVTPEEVRESNRLIGSVIENWPVLRNTSVGGFREAFLLREGHLALTEEGWKLRVERRGHDVLRDSLPWGVSLVVLPWMKQPLFVEW